MDVAAKTMVEVEGRFLVFAKIGMLKIDYVNNFFVDLKDKFSLEASVATIQSPFGIANFPALESSRVVVQFLQDHIEVIEKNPSDTNFDFYREVAGAFYKMINEALKVPVTRLAVNGLLRIDDEKAMEKIRRSVFKENAPLMLSGQDAWGFRVIDTQSSSILGEKMNCCVTVDKILPEDTPDNKTELMVLYDYNTKMEQKNNFSLDEIKYFIDDGEKFKRQIVEEVQK